MEIYNEIKQLKKFYKTPVREISEKIGVTEKYVRDILSGRRKCTKHKKSKGKQIIEFAKQLIKEE